MPKRKAGIRRDDPGSWPDGPLGLNWKGLKRNRAFNVLVDNDAVRTALDAIFGPGQWLQPKPGAQILLTLPRPGAWVLPGTWHMDCGFERPSWPVHGVKLFAFFGEVGPEGGGTMVLPGTHRVVDEYRRSLPPGTGAGMANWHQAAQAVPFPGPATQRSSDARRRPVAGRPGRRRERGAGRGARTDR